MALLLVLCKCRQSRETQGCVTSASLPLLLESSSGGVLISKGKHLWNVSTPITSRNRLAKECVLKALLA